MNEIKAELSLIPCKIKENVWGSSALSLAVLVEKCLKQKSFLLVKEGSQTQRGEATAQMGAQLVGLGVRAGSVLPLAAGGLGRGVHRTQLGAW